MKSVCGMLNKFGEGKIFFGVKNDGTVIKNEITDSSLRDISRAVYESIEPKISPFIDTIVIDNIEIIRLSFHGNNQPYSSKGVYYKRVADENRPMSQLELENVRLACKTKREKAIVEVLYSTGCRVTELERLNISDVNFETKEITLFGKGDKHRISYLNAKAEVSLKDYLNERTDNNPALFVYDRKPYSRFKKSGIESMVRKIMERTSDVSTHVTPHIFRHTTATLALRRGMTLVQVSEVLGHKRIETTMEYIENDKKLLKDKHLNCIM